MTAQRSRAFVIGFGTALLIWFAWGAWRPIPVVQDEYSYVLQARIFASGHWTAPPPPVPSAFQQPHVLSTPRVASKYPPGHALALALGALLGAPWLAVLVLGGITATLIHGLTRRVYGGAIGLFVVGVWLGDPINLRFLPGYYSELTSGLSWLVAWWCLLEWRRSFGTRYLLVLSAAIGVDAITRPLSALAFALPIGVVVLRDALRAKRLRDLGLAIVVGSVILGILPAWSYFTTGSATTSPIALYQRRYLPFDKPGFGLDRTPPTDTLSPPNEDVYNEFAQEHARHTVSALPRIAFERLAVIAHDEWSGWRVLLVPLVVIGVLTAATELQFAIACGIALFAGYLTYAHWKGWTLYYYEALPIVAFSTGAGLHWLLKRLREGTATRALTLSATVVALLTASSLWRARREHVALAGYDSGFHRLLAELPVKSAVVFVRYAPDSHPHSTVVTNSAALSTDRFWVVIDNPATNRAVLAAANGRAPLLFEEHGATLSLYKALLDSIAPRR